jgi:thiol-disulfide isomerase/thioredoxin
MPEAELPDLQGNMQALRGLYGPKLTVVCFWAGGNSKYSELSAVELLADLEKDLFEPYVAKGVQVVGINVGGNPQAAGSLLSQAGTRFPNLLDPQGVFFAKVATEKIPRIYLLDAIGKIIWFDVEYSRSTRRDLLQAIRVVLEEL